MKKTCFFFGLLICLVLACNKDDDDNDGPIVDPIPEYVPRYYEYEINFQFETDTTLVRIESSEDTLFIKEPNSIFFKFKDSLETYELLFYVQNLNGLGTYDQSYVQVSGQSNGVHLEGGSVTISEINEEANYMKGTFNASCCSNGVNFIVKNGSFVIDYWE